MPNFSEIREALATNLAGLAGVTAYATVQPELDAPASVVGPLRSTVPQPRLGRLQPGTEIVAVWTIPIRIYMGDPSEIATQDDLDVLIDWNAAGKIVKAIESDATLGGIAHGVTVTEIGKYGTMPIGNATFIGVEVIVQVIA